LSTSNDVNDEKDPGAGNTFNLVIFVQSRRNTLSGCE